ncbi:MAG: IS3 family transposase [Ignavibacteria bacterium]|nr:IS3 family transposase [Ignavibacteria bacterium]
MAYAAALHHFPFRSAQHASNVINHWLHLFYNPRRRHKSIGGMSPMEYQSQWISNELILQSS